MYDAIVIGSASARTGTNVRVALARSTVGRVMRPYERIHRPMSSKSYYAENVDLSVSPVSPPDASASLRRPAPERWRAVGRGGSPAATDSGRPFLLAHDRAPEMTRRRGAWPPSCATPRRTRVTTWAQRLLLPDGMARLCPPRA